MNSDFSLNSGAYSYTTSYKLEDFTVQVISVENLILDVDYKMCAYMVGGVETRIARVLLV